MVRYLRLITGHICFMFFCVLAQKKNSKCILRLYPAFESFYLPVFIRVVNISNNLKKQLGSKCSVVKGEELSC